MKRLKVLSIALSLLLVIGVLPLATGDAVKASEGDVATVEDVVEDEADVPVDESIPTDEETPDSEAEIQTNEQMGFVDDADINDSVDIAVEDCPNPDVCEEETDLIEENYDEVGSYDAMNSSSASYPVGRLVYYVTIKDDGTIRINSINSSSSGVFDIVIPSTLGGRVVNELYSNVISYEIRDRVLSVVVPNSVTDINDSAFRDCTNVTSITLPSGLTSINDWLFSGDISLTSINIPSTVRYIGMGAFERCSSLTSVTIPEGITTLDCPVNVAIFCNCSNLRTVYLPHSIRYVYCIAFDGCNNLTDVYYAGTSGEANSIVFEGTRSSSPLLNATWHYTGIDMYRLYNPNSGEHFYTSSRSERDMLVSVGWSYEAVGWIAPPSSNTPVYRLYNSHGGEHHYTTSLVERNNLISIGWDYEGIGWYSDDFCRVPLYRQYNPNAFSNNHNYTTSWSENNWLVTLGWQAEGIGWYGVG